MAGRQRAEHMLTCRGRGLNPRPLAPLSNALLVGWLLILSQIISSKIKINKFPINNVSVIDHFINFQNILQIR